MKQFSKKIFAKNQKGRQLRASVFLMLFFCSLVLLYVVMNMDTEEKVYAPELSAEEIFIQKVGPYAKKQQMAYEVLPSITIAQAILESDWGTSTLSSEYNNYFGIKGSSESNTVLMKTMEFENDEWVEIKDRFRSYEKWQESFDDHALLFLNGTTWNPDQYITVRNAKTYQEAAHALETSGYATDPTYAAKLIELIEQYKLYKYDQ